MSHHSEYPWATNLTLFLMIFTLSSVLFVKIQLVSMMLGPYISQTGVTLLDSYPVIIFKCFINIFQLNFRYEANLGYVWEHLLEIQLKFFVWIPSFRSPRMLEGEWFFRLLESCLVCTSSTSSVSSQELLYLVSSALVLTYSDTNCETCGISSSLFSTSGMVSSITTLMDSITVLLWILYTLKALLFLE